MSDRAAVFAVYHELSGCVDQLERLEQQGRDPQPLLEEIRALRERLGAMAERAHEARRVLPTPVPSGVHVQRLTMTGRSPAEGAALPAITGQWGRVRR